MSLKLWECPLCKGTLMSAFGSLPTGSIKGNTTFYVTCPLCSEEFEMGYVQEFRMSRAAPDSTQQLGEERPSVGGGGSVGHLSEAPSQNDQRANVRNPNNPAYLASGDNRSNQMNPNNPAYRSSRGRR